jgi:hypothetical protein
LLFPYISFNFLNFSVAFLVIHAHDIISLRKILDLQHQYNNCTTTPHMRVGLTHWGPSSCEGLLYSCCNSVVQESNPIQGDSFKHLAIEWGAAVIRPRSYVDHAGRTEFNHYATRASWSSLYSSSNGGQPKILISVYFQHKTTPNSHFSSMTLFLQSQQSILIEHTTQNVSFSHQNSHFLTKS